MVLEDTIKVVIDHDLAPEEERKDVDTGLFNCIHRGKNRIEVGSDFTGKMEITGKTVKDNNLEKY